MPRRKDSNGFLIIIRCHERKSLYAQQVQSDPKVAEVLISNALKSRLMELGMTCSDIQVKRDMTT